MIQLLRILVVLPFASMCSTVLCLAGENIVSKATGHHGLISLLQSVKLQDEIELSPPQLEALKAAVNELGVKEEYSRVWRINRKNGVDAETCGKLATKAADILAQKAMRKAQLHEEQIKRFRCFQIRDRCQFPSKLFVKEVLRELELDQSAVEEVLSRVNPLIVEMHNLLDKQLRQALAEIFRSHDSEKASLMELVGSELLDRSTLPDVKNIEQLEICKESQPFSQLLLYMYTVFPERQRLTDDQMQSLQSLQSKELVRRAKDPAGNTTALLRKELGAILTPTQRVDVIRGLHERALRYDINWLTRPEVLSYLKMSDEKSDDMKTKVKQWKETMTAAKIKAERRILPEGINAMPKDLRDGVSRLVDGVWQEVTSQ